MRPSERAAELAARVAAAASAPRARRLLLLDFDGTLAPVARTPDAARLPEPTRRALQRLVGGGWRVAIVSGRALRDLRRLLRLRGALVFGSHGLERPDGHIPDVPEGVLARLRRVEKEGQRLAEGTAGVLVERKPVGVAFHDRLVRDERLAAWRARLRAFLAEQDLRGVELLAGRRVLELRPRGANKGSVVKLLVGRSRVADESIVAAGDDRTDEDMFRALDGRGLSIRVGRRDRPTLADEGLPSALAFGAFLDELARLEGSGRDGEPAAPGEAQSSSASRSSLLAALAAASRSSTRRRG